MFGLPSRGNHRTAIDDCQLKPAAIYYYFSQHNSPGASLVVVGVINTASA